MATVTERNDRQAAKPARREKQADLYDPHFPNRRRTVRLDPDAVFSPHFPTHHRAQLGS